MGVERRHHEPRRRAMQGDAPVIKFLNEARYNELTAINQYFLPAKMLKNWGPDELAKHEYEESIDELYPADLLAQRILFLDGLPNFHALGNLKTVRNPKKIPHCTPDPENEDNPP